MHVVIRQLLQNLSEDLPGIVEGLFTLHVLNLQQSAYQAWKLGYQNFGFVVPKLAGFLSWTEELCESLAEGGKLG
jgi:hypothetical protein